MNKIILDIVEYFEARKEIDNLEKSKQEVPLKLRKIVSNVYEQLYVYFIYENYFEYQWLIKNFKNKSVISEDFIQEFDCADVIARLETDKFMESDDFKKLAEFCVSKKHQQFGQIIGDIQNQCFDLEIYFEANKQNIILEKKYEVIIKKAFNEIESFLNSN